ncbi:MAG: IS5 family transposase [Cyanobacteria bacterium REEB67]|nr:IS5 family transposase [Cyanobacteria bacterium REEB67]MBX9720465.1 IS5 family transposase [Candidatus Obscuribacterales bacterium]
MSLQKSYQMTIVAGVFQAKLNPSNELLILAEKINWEAITEALAPSYSNLGRAGKPIRLMVGAHILKHMHDMSDEDVAKRLGGDVYWMAFCGIDEPFVTEDWQPLNASTMTYFRKRIGPSGVAKIDQVILEQLLTEKRIEPKSQFVDTTAMEKDVAYPTDTELLDKGRRRVVSGLKKLKQLGRKISIGQTFTRVAKKALLEIIKLGKDRQERIKKGAELLAKFAKVVLKRVPSALRKAKKHNNKDTQKRIEAVQEQIRTDSELLTRVIAQTAARYAGTHVKKKVYSYHEPQVTCIAKGKRGKPNEYGSKVSLAVDKNGFVVTHKVYDSNVGDTKTLEEAVSDWETATGQMPEELAADRGYHMAKYPEKLKNISRIAIPRTGKRKHQDSDKAYFRRLQRKRASIEPVFSHLKQDHRMNRCRYKGFKGDQINVSLAASAWNARKWMKQMASEAKRAKIA